MVRDTMGGIDAARARHFTATTGMLPALLLVCGCGSSVATEPPPQSPPGFEAQASTFQVEIDHEFKAAHIDEKPDRAKLHPSAPFVIATQDGLVSPSCEGAAVVLRKDLPAQVIPEVKDPTIFCIAKSGTSDKAWDTYLVPTVTRLVSSNGLAQADANKGVFKCTGSEPESCEAERLYLVPGVRYAIRPPLQATDTAAELVLGFGEAEQQASNIPAEGLTSVANTKQAVVYQGELPTTAAKGDFILHMSAVDGAQKVDHPLSVGQVVDIFVHNIPRGQADLQVLEVGAVPVSGLNSTIINLLNSIRSASALTPPSAATASSQNLIQLPKFNDGYSVRGYASQRLQVHVVDDNEIYRAEVCDKPQPTSARQVSEYVEQAALALRAASAQLDAGATGAGATSDVALAAANIYLSQSLSLKDTDASLMADAGVRLRRAADAQDLAQLDTAAENALHVLCDANSFTAGTRLLAPSCAGRAAAGQAGPSQPFGKVLYTAAVVIEFGAKMRSTGDTAPLGMQLRAASDQLQQGLTSASATGASPAASSPSVAMASDTLTAVSSSLQTAAAAATGASGCNSATPAIEATLDFQTLPFHRTVGLAVDLGWTATATSPLSGYSYVPVSQTGPDQFYELVGQSKWADHTTLSALLMFYPLPLLQAAPPRRSVDRAIWGGFGVGFGPTFWRGAGAEAFKQWNLRISIAELYPGLVFSMGPSWRTYDRALMANTVVSVPKPATAPSTFQTTPDSDVEFSLGLSVDLSLIASGISTVAGAIIPSSATVTPPPKSTP